MDEISTKKNNNNIKHLVADDGENFRTVGVKMIPIFALVAVKCIVLCVHVCARDSNTSNFFWKTLGKF